MKKHQDAKIYYFFRSIFKGKLLFFIKHEKMPRNQNLLLLLPFHFQGQAALLRRAGKNPRDTPIHPARANSNQTDSKKDIREVSAETSTTSGAATANAATANAAPVLREQVENVPQHAAVCLVEFGVSAAFAGDVGEFLVLDVEEFADCAAGCADFAGFVGGVAAFGADEVYFIAHSESPFYYTCSVQVLCMRVFKDLWKIFLDGI